MSAKTFTKLTLAIVACLGLNQLTAPAASAAPITWTTATSQASGTGNQLRAVAVSNEAGNDSVYLGYIQTSGTRRIDRRDLDSPYSVLNTHASGFDQPKGIVTDDRGNVFVANRNSSSSTSRIESFSSALASNFNTGTVGPVIGGLALYKSGSDYYAYAAFEAGGLIQRYNVTNPGSMTLDASFGTGGSYNIPGAADLRGIEVAADGTIFVASRDANRVYKVAADLSSSSFVTLTKAMDVALYGGNAYVTSYNGASSLIQVLSQSDLSTVDTIAITTLDGNPYTRLNNTEGWSGIDIDANGNIWLADQNYGSTGGTQDRLLLGSTLAVPEPGTVALAGLAAFVFAGMRRRRLGT